MVFEITKTIPLQMAMLLFSTVLISLAIVCAGTVAWIVLSWVWLRPKSVERSLRQQGLTGNSYKILHGDVKELLEMKNQSSLTPIQLSDDICPRVIPFQHSSIQIYGKKSFIWMGTKARVNVMEPNLIRELLSNYRIFQKVQSKLGRSILAGLIGYEGDKWAKHRRIINTAFHSDKLKDLLAEVQASCEEMFSHWDEILKNNERYELDLWAWFENMTGEVISRAAFGSNFEEGRQIFLLLRTVLSFFMKALPFDHIPGWRFMPTQTNKKIKKTRNEIHFAIREIIHKRELAIMTGKGRTDDLLGTLLKSNAHEIDEGKGKQKKGMSLHEIIEECKLFYMAGQETTRITLLWTMVLLSQHQNWQNRAREEVYNVFGKKNLDNEGLSQLKIVGMILNEVLRLYPPATELIRTVNNETKLGELCLPTGAQVCVPILLIHYDREIWGDDAHEFNPARFSEGISNAAKFQPAFLPFSFGPRVCVGQSFAMIEAKAALAMILQRYTFELSSSYVHAPWNHITLQPQYGAPVILHKI